MPEPTKEIVQDANSRILIDIRDDFLGHLKSERYKKMFRAIFNYVIIKYDFDKFYKGCINWCFGEAMRRGWNLGYSRPHDNQWKE